MGWWFAAVSGGSGILLGVATGLRAFGFGTLSTNPAGRDACRYSELTARKLKCFSS
jgi:hypothetical protein